MILSPYAYKICCARNTIIEQIKNKLHASSLKKKELLFVNSSLLLDNLRIKSFAAFFQQFSVVVKLVQSIDIFAIITDN